MCHIHIALNTCTVKEEVVKFEIFKLKYPACYVLVQGFNFIGSQALRNQSKYHIKAIFNLLGVF